MGERTSREIAWLQAIEAPAFSPVVDACQIPSARSCVEAAHSAVSQSRRLLAETSPALADWSRYLGS